MIVTKDFPSQVFSSKEELYKALRENKSKLFATKLATIKQADSVNYSVSKQCDLSTNKEQTEAQENINKIIVKFVVNSCGWFDSHRDVHVKGCWNKTASDKGRFVHLQEHKATFDNIISNNAVKSVEQIDIKGVNVDALICTSTIDKKDNPKMFERYKEGKVTEHSVGMQYIWDKLHLCIDSNHEDDKEEKENWDKYYDQVINKDELNEVGYFWAVGEAKAIEASAVVFGSNSQTPTIEVTEVKEEPTKVTQNKEEEPLKDTLIELSKILKEI